MQPLNFSAVLVLFLCCLFQLSSAWYVLFFSRKESFKCYSFYGFAIGKITYRFNIAIFFPLYRTMNNFLMTGPKAYLTYASSVRVGAQSGIQECKRQFALEKWNCPENTLSLSPHNGMRSATRETSFVHAISAAGVMYTLTKNCTAGDFDNCGCDDSKIGQPGGVGWIWGGCSDNVAFGEKISKQFVDALEDGHDSRAAVNLHNNKAGRLAIKATMRKACKCHGVSGSCTIQTCWMQMADFREVGNYLKMKYKHAKELEMDKKAARAGNSADNRDAVTHTFLSVATRELIYLESSPNYCVKNQTLGLHGTEGRECFKEDKNMSEWEKNSCRRLCNECGLKVVKKRTEVFTSCNCKFHWCCTVKCEKCKRVVAKYFCAHKSGRKKNKKGRNSAHQQ
uniref:Protein Wnt n=3 Tax=Haplochromini TaxID=319058 RepID=A0A3P9BLS8_9CICH